MLNALERQRHTVANANTHGGERTPSALFFETMQRRHGQPRTRHTKRMADRDGAAMRIDLFGIVGKLELAQTR